MTKFLVVDDEPADLALLKGLLEKQGHEVLTAKTAQRGLDLVRREHPDVAILDILLPDENGLEVYSQMRALDGRLPIIFATASGSSNTAIEAMQLGALDYLTKPLNVAEVKKVIERALEVRTSHFHACEAPCVSRIARQSVFILQDNLPSAAKLSDVVLH